MIENRMRWIATALLLALIALGQPANIAAQDPPAADPVPANSGELDPAAGDVNQEKPASPNVPDSFFDILGASGLVGFLIILLSVAVVALVIEHLMTIRTSVLVPKGLAEEVLEALKAGQAAQAVQRCKLQPSLLSSILLAGLNEPDPKWTSREKAMEDAAASESARLYRKIEYLAVIGNIAPMLGLLGTVVGMMLSFRTVASTAGVAKPEDLAGGIYLALVTTVEGLVVAIPSLSAFAFFRNQVDKLVADASTTAMAVFAPFRRVRASEREA